MNSQEAFSSTAWTRPPSAPATACGGDAPGGRHPLIGTVVFAVTAREQPGCRHENPPNSLHFQFVGYALAGFRSDAIIVCGPLVSTIRPVLPRRRSSSPSAASKVDHVTIYRWVQPHAAAADAARPCRHRVVDRWQVDEPYVKVAGQCRCVYRAIDQFAQGIEVFVSVPRTPAAPTGSSSGRSAPPRSSPPRSLPMRRRCIRRGWRSCRQRRGTASIFATQAPTGNLPLPGRGTETA
jgi:hypothetical protein